MDQEKKLVSACLQDQGILKKAHRSNIGPDDVDNDVFRYLLESSLDLFALGDNVTKESLEEYINKDDIPSDSKKEALHFADKLYDQDVDGAHFTVQQLNKKKQKKEVVEASYDLVEGLEQGRDVSDLLKEHSERISYLEEADYTEYQLWNYFEDNIRRKRERHEIDQGGDKTLSFDLHLSPFEDYFKRGWQVQEISAVAGPTYAGKSTLASNIIYLGVHPTNGLDGLYVFAENRKVQAGSRLDSIFLDREYDELFRDPLNDNYGDKFHEEAVEDGYGNLNYGKVIPNKFDVNTIRSLIRDTREGVTQGSGTDGFDPDFLVIDSPDHQRPSNEHDQYFANKGQVYWDIKQLAEEEDLIVITTLPMKPSSRQKDSVSAEDTAGSYDIARIVDNMISFNVDKEDRLVNRAKLEVVKNRDGDIDAEQVHLKFQPSMRMVPENMDQATIADKDEARTFEVKDYTREDEEGGDE